MRPVWRFSTILFENTWFSKEFLRCIQGLNYLSRSELRKFSDQVQWVRSKGERCKLPHWVFEDKAPKDFGQNAIQIQKNNVQFNTFWGKTKAICWVWSLNKSLKTKNSNRRIVLIHEFDKKLLKGICEKAKWIRESWFADRQFEPWYSYISSYLPKLNSGLELVSETHFHEMSDFE